MKKFLSDFKTFCMRGNIVDMAVGVMIGGAFGSIVSSLVNDVFMPLIGLLMGGLNVSGLFVALDGGIYPTLEAATAARAATLNYGMFLQKVIDFLIMALCVFMVVRLMAKLMPKKPAKPVRKCPFCKQEIAEDATRCPHCTSELSETKSTLGA